MERPASLRPTFEGLGVEALGDFADRPLRQWGPLPRLLLCEPGDSCASPPSKRLLLAPKMYNSRAKVASGRSLGQWALLTYIQITKFNPLAVFNQL